MSLEFIKGSQLPVRNAAANDDYIFVISGGVTYKMLRSVFLAGISGGSQNLQQVTGLGAITTIPITVADGIDSQVLGIASNTLRLDDSLVTGEIHQITRNNVGETVYVREDLSTSTTTKFQTPTGNGALVYPDVVDVEETIATREWTENLLEGLKTKQPVRVATTANITLSGTQTIDGVALSVDDRVLVKDNSTQSQNGMYLVKAGAWVRTDDANTATELTNAVVSVLEGTANTGATFRQITTSITLGSSNIVWQSFGSSVPDATDTTKGKMKLFTDLLNSFTDGSVTQAAIVAALAGKANKRTLVSLSSNKSLTNTTSLQALFDDVFEVEACEYTFFIEASMASLPASGAIFFGTLGTAGVTSINWVSNGNKQNVFPATNQIQIGNVTTAVQICSASAGQNGVMVVTGRVVFSGSGTFIPAVGFSTAPSSGVVNAGSSGSIIKID